MSRNLKPDYIRKLIKTEAPKGYKFDVGNYLHNPCYSFDYPSFFKRVSEDLETFADAAAAKRWIVANMAEQEKTAWHSAGLVDVKREETPTGYTMTVTPALTLMRGLTLTYEIVPA